MPRNSKEQLVAAHNKKYNPRGIKRGEPTESENATAVEPEAKRLCIEKNKPLSEESMIQDKLLSYWLLNTFCVSAESLNPRIIDKANLWYSLFVEWC